MTFKIQERNFSDKLLTMMGKKRALRIPTDAYQRFGPYVILQAKKESSWRALARPRNQELADGWFYPYDSQ